MKTIWTTFLGLLIAVNFAIAQDTLYVYKTGAVVYKSVISAVDSVTFQKVYTPLAITDIDGNVYTSVTIGNQTWMVENLKTTHYRNGDAIANITDNTAWGALTSGAWCDYSNLAANGNIYGHLYNWYAVNDSRKIAPVGWHLPSEQELIALTDFLGGESEAGAKLKKTGTSNWLSPNTAATNESGFTALPGGYRAANGSFNDLGAMFSVWSTTQSSISNAWGRLLISAGGQVLHENWTKNLGFSIRCIRNGAPTVTTSAVSGITTTTATAGGNVVSDGGESVLARGVCWSISPNPTIALSTKTTETSNSGTIASALTDLSANTKYYIRAYATNAFGTSYGDEVNFTTTAESTTVTDIDGNVYAAVTIGTQTWMAENLKTTKYRDGSSITNVKDLGWSFFPKEGWCDYENIVANGTKYGHIYNWYAVSDSRNIAPVGWHVATDAEWTTLESYISDNLGSSLNVAKALAASTEWTTHSTIGNVGNNIALNNSTGFSALPGGYRSNDGTFFAANNLSFWWSSTTDGSNRAWYRQMSYNSNLLSRNSFDFRLGFSVRCVKDKAPILSATTSVSAISSSNASVSGNVSSDGGTPITARGVCWSTSAAPTIALSNKSTEPGTVGEFSSVIINLTAGTKYYVRAYATNSAGTSYGNEISFTTRDATAGITDVDGNIYTSVTIGTQTWMVENLRTTHYRDGSAINNLSNSSYKGGWCDYQNSAANGIKYGHLYNWYAVSDSRNIAPVGWHVATDAEWATLENYVSANLGVSTSVAKALAATTDWPTYPSFGSIGNDFSLNNSAGFHALPGGYRSNTGAFENQQVFGVWWSSSMSTSTNSAWIRSLCYNMGLILRGSNPYEACLSVRCVKD